MQISIACLTQYIIKHEEKFCGGVFNNINTRILVIWISKVLTITSDVRLSNTLFNMISNI